MIPLEVPTHVMLSIPMVSEGWCDSQPQYSQRLLNELGRKLAIGNVPEKFRLESYRMFAAHAFLI